MNAVFQFLDCNKSSFSLCRQSSTVLESCAVYFPKPSPSLYTCYLLGLCRIVTEQSKQERVKSLLESQSMESILVKVLDFCRCLLSHLHPCFDFRNTDLT